MGEGGCGSVGIRSGGGGADEGILLDGIWSFVVAAGSPVAVCCRGESGGAVVFVVCQGSLNEMNV